MAFIQEKISLPAGSPGNVASIEVLRLGENQEKKVYLQAGLHADEWPGILVLHHLLPLLRQAEDEGRLCAQVVLVPFANPVGMRQFLNGYQLGRFDFDYSGNFNRGYADLADGALAYLDREMLLHADKARQVAMIRSAFHRVIKDWQPAMESECLRKVLQGLAFDADYVFDLHCDSEACVHVFCNVRHQETGELLAAAMSAKALILEDDPGGMAFDEAAASPWWRLERSLQMSLPYTTFACTLELRGQRDLDDKQNQMDALNLYRFMCQRGLVDDPCVQKVQLPEKALGTPHEGVDMVKAPHTGIAVFCKKPGEQVEKGELVAEVIELVSQERTPVYAGTSGVVFSRYGQRLVRPGHVLLQIAGAEALAYRKGHLLAF